MNVRDCSKWFRDLASRIRGTKRDRADKAVAGVVKSFRAGVPNVHIMFAISRAFSILGRVSTHLVTNAKLQDMLSGLFSNFLEDFTARIMELANMIEHVTGDEQVSKDVEGLILDFKSSRRVRKEQREIDKKDKDAKRNVKWHIDDILEGDLSFLSSIKVNDLVDILASDKLPPEYRPYLEKILDKIQSDDLFKEDEVYDDDDDDDYGKSIKDKFEFLTNLSKSEYEKFKEKLGLKGLDYLEYHGLSFYKHILNDFSIPIEIKRYVESFKAEADKEKERCKKRALAKKEAFAKNGYKTILKEIKLKGTNVRLGTDQSDDDDDK